MNDSSPWKSPPKTNLESTTPAGVPKRLQKDKISRATYTGHRTPRSRRPEETHRPPAIVTMRVSGPYRAEHLKKKLVGARHENIEDAMEEARAMGVGARVFSSEGILLAKFESAAKYAMLDLDDPWKSPKGDKLKEPLRKPGRPPKTADDVDEEDA